MKRERTLSSRLLSSFPSTSSPSSSSKSMKRGLEKFAFVEEGMKSHSRGAAAARK